MSKAFYVILTALSMHSVVNGQIPSPDDLRSVTESPEAKKFFQETWSPYCPGLSLHDCTSAQAATLRLEIAKSFREGKTAEQILIELQESFGPTVSMIPPKKGWSASAYYIPFVVLFLALLFFLRKIIKPQRRKPPSVAPASKSEVDHWLR